MYAYECYVSTVEQSFAIMTKQTPDRSFVDSCIVKVNKSFVLVQKRLLDVFFVLRIKWKKWRKWTYRIFSSSDALLNKSSTLVSPLSFRPLLWSSEASKYTISVLSRVFCCTRDDSKHFCCYCARLQDWLTEKSLGKLTNSSDLFQNMYCKLLYQNTIVHHHNKIHFFQAKISASAFPKN